MAKREKTHPLKGSPEAERLRAEEDDLFRRFRATGSQQLCQEIANRFRDDIYAYCLKRLHIHDDAEDAVQETFLVLLRRRKTTKSKTLRGFLIRSAGYATSEIKRRRHSHPPLNEQQGENVTDRAPTAASELRQHDDLIRFLWKVIAQMSAADQSLLAARYHTGRTILQLAHDLEVPEATEEKRCYRAIKRLKQRLEKSLPPSLWPANWPPRRAGDG